MIKIFRDFLPEHQAEYLSNSIINTKEDWWSYAIKHSATEKVLYYKNNIQQREALLGVQPTINLSFVNGQFTYKFKRSTKHVDSCNCYECTFRQTYLESKEFKDFISKEAEIENPKIYETFVSVYERGDFLSMHHDGKRGVAFIFNLTKNWLPEYGGLLNVVQEDGTYKAIVPEYNSLVLLTNLGETGTNHFVSEISAIAPRARLAISGWYN
jgi:Rps23 Pro-64 3,4-dihydroxylase Tpa1-like proline 4-hydroxylase